MPYLQKRRSCGKKTSACLLGKRAEGNRFFWESFVIEQALRAIRPAEAHFWATHGGAELDLLTFHRGRHYGVEAKFSEAPEVTRSMHIALDSLALDHLWEVHPGSHTYPVDEKITMCAVPDLVSLASQMA